MRRNLTIELPDLDIAWLAGLLEGEGSFMMARNNVGGRTYRYPKITVNMTDKDVIASAAKMFGTSVYVMPQYNPNLKPQWRATVQGSRAAALMRAVLPWMGNRRSARIGQILDEYDQAETTQSRRRRSNALASSKRARSSGRFVRQSA